MMRTLRLYRRRAGDWSIVAGTTGALALVALAGALAYLLIVIVDALTWLAEHVLQGAGMIFVALVYGTTDFLARYSWREHLAFALFIAGAFAVALLLGLHQRGGL
jgi:hypothetical protein